MIAASMGKDKGAKTKHGGAAKVNRKLAVKAPDNDAVVAPPQRVAANKKNVRMVKRLNFKKKVDTAIMEKSIAKRAQSSLSVLALEGALDDTSSHSETLMKGPPKPAASIRKNKAKKNLQHKEVQQFQAVLAHGAFQANPFATIKEHLTNTVTSSS